MKVENTENVHGEHFITQSVIEIYIVKFMTPQITDP